MILEMIASGLSGAGFPWFFPGDEPWAGPDGLPSFAGADAAGLGIQGWFIMEAIIPPIPGLSPLPLCLSLFCSLVGLWLSGREFPPPPEPGGGFEEGGFCASGPAEGSNEGGFEDMIDGTRILLVSVRVKISTSSGGGVDSRAGASDESTFGNLGSVEGLNWGSVEGLNWGSVEKLGGGTVGTLDGGSVGTLSVGEVGGTSVVAVPAVDDCVGDDCVGEGWVGDGCVVDGSAEGSLLVNGTGGGRDVREETVTVEHGNNGGSGGGVVSVWLRAVTGTVIFSVTVMVSVTILTGHAGTRNTPEQFEAVTVSSIEDELEGPGPGPAVMVLLSVSPIEDELEEVAVMVLLSASSIEDELEGAAAVVLLSVPYIEDELEEVAVMVLLSASPIEDVLEGAAAVLLLSASSIEDELEGAVVMVLLSDGIMVGIVGSVRQSPSELQFVVDGPSERTSVVRLTEMLDIEVVLGVEVELDVEIVLDVEVELDFALDVEVELDVEVLDIDFALDVEGMLAVSLDDILSLVVEDVVDELV
jgi:hypothetical protein